MKFSNHNRSEIINKLKNETFDVLVIGGGITGAGIALDASTRGMKVALVEMQDFAAGTSSRSTKLVHGGLRYLKQFEVQMVAEVGKERAIVYENGPHVTTPEWMLLPMHKGGTFGKFSTSIGLRVYDFLAGVKKAERRTMLNVQETINKEPLVKKNGLKGGGYYVEYRTDDARLTIEVMKAAADKGATPLNYTKVDQLLYDNGKVIGVLVVDQLTGEKFEIKAEKIVNAAGPWVDTIREKDGSKKGKTLQLTKGVHIVIDQSRFPLKQAVYFDTPDKRMVFAIPREGKAYVGTTDTFYGDDPVNPHMTAEDRTYIIEAINYMFPDVEITEKDVESSWAGVRPLIWEEGKDPSEISRKDEIWESESGMITIAGGKLTGYRKMAETIVDVLAKKFSEEQQRNFPSCQTKHLPISGGEVGGSSKFKGFIGGQIETGVAAGLTKEDAAHLAAMYGSNVPALFKMVEEHGNKEAENYQLPVKLWVKLKYALENEMAATPIDFFNRRIGAILFDIETVRTYQEQVMNYMTDYFKWNQDARAKFELQLQQALKDATVPSDLQ
ncbi:glycerol-3-phosphate dehydrogenase/oxidase [Cytobacillus praedii]|uniref:Glycerol-3-phosphate dehydrogenase n=1 Tax=Cytobacillus praedii TaxID=1742358 RepID=A0A4R1ARZ0_9BACI|nr:glycerol-3-phosphate dehydrogenase/oxidase [Cytobacillus praedii]TCJ02857.1 glycerol-3-phosphate dehydrogenase/oxidase [Cytobacillus praedii]